MYRILTLSEMVIVLTFIGVLKVNLVMHSVTPLLNQGVWYPQRLIYPPLKPHLLSHPCQIIPLLMIVPPGSFLCRRM